MNNTQQIAERHRSSGPGHSGNENVDIDREKNGDTKDRENQGEKAKSLAEKLK